MDMITATRKAIKDAGDVSALARSLSERTGIDEHKLIGRIKMWRYNGVSRQFAKPLSEESGVPVELLMPDIY